MNAEYQDALDYLYGLVNFEHRRIEQYAPENISLDRPAHLLELLDNPQESYPSIHIAGTKGKGSVAAMCAASLRAAGYKVGLYTSPHLQDFRDRIRVLSPVESDGRISRNQVVEAVKAVRRAAAEVPGLTWYELVTAIAFRHFAREEVDVAVVEVGLGGRLDATNLLTPMVSVITSLSLDHTYLLGDTLGEIAAEKGGIIKPGIPLVCAPQASEALDVLIAIAQRQRAPMTVIGDHWDGKAGTGMDGGAAAAGDRKQELIVTRSPSSAFVPPFSHFTLALSGKHQRENALVALAALDKVRHRFGALTLDAVAEGLASVEWPGRLQTLYSGSQDGDSVYPTVLVDCAHNVDSAEKLAFALTHDYTYRDLKMILGITVDKDISGILRVLLPLTDQAVVTASSHPRAASPLELLRLANDLGYEAQASPNVSDALRVAWRNSNSDDLICVAGSIFIAGDLLNNWESLQSELMAGGSRPSAFN